MAATSTNAAALEPVTGSVFPFVCERPSTDAPGEGVWLDRAGPMLVELLRRQDVVGIFETLLRYLFAADSSVSFETVRTMIERSEAAQSKERVMSIAEELIQKGRKEAMSIAEELIQKGRKEGRQEGRQEGALIGRIQMLQELLGLPVSQFVELADKPVEDLDILAQELRSRLTSRAKT